MFIEEGENIRKEIILMLMEFIKTSIDRLDAELQELVDLGINSIMLFGIPKKKMQLVLNLGIPEGVVQQAARYIKIPSIPNCIL